MGGEDEKRGRSQRDKTSKDRLAEGIEGGRQDVTER
jgi:hypothetical protein